VDNVSGGATYLSVDGCCSELARSNATCWSNTRYHHLKETRSRHNCKHGHLALHNNHSLQQDYSVENLFENNTKYDLCIICWIWNQ